MVTWALSWTIYCCVCVCVCLCVCVCACVCIRCNISSLHREQRYEENMASMLECVRLSHSNAWTTDPMMQLKITALLSPELCVSHGQSEPLSEIVF